MVLVLEFASSQGAPGGSASRKVFSTEGGTIGRASSNDWVLPHRKVSGRHALVTWQDGIFYIVDDNSANGVFINSTSKRLVPGKRYALKTGDRIIIDPYELVVSIGAGHADEVRSPFGESAGFRSGEAAGVYDPLASLEPPVQPRSRTPSSGVPPPSRPTPAGEVVPLEELDPLKLLEGTPKPPAREVPRAIDLDRKSPLSEHYQPPAISAPPPQAAPLARNPFEIPADYDPLSPDYPEEPIKSKPAPLPPPQAVREPAPPPAPAARETPSPPLPPPAEFVLERSPDVTPPADVARLPEAPSIVPGPAVPDAGLVDVLRGAGLQQAPVTPEFARSFGQIFRVVVSGVMDVLRARQQIKDEFRMRMTQFRTADNNPLKFSANVDDALHNLLVKRNAAYLEPVEAFEDAFDDLRNHQLAMLAGMRVAFESMLAHFNPEYLQQQFDRQLKRTALLGMTARLKYWELYCERHEEMAKDPEVTFRRVFGEEFARAYEEQLRRLKAESRSRPAAPPSEH